MIQFMFKIPKWWQFAWLTKKYKKTNILILYLCYEFTKLYTYSQASIIVIELDRVF